MFIKLIDGVPVNYTMAQLRQDNPHTSFPQNVPAETLAEYNVYPVTRTPMPSYNTLTQSVRAVTPVQIGDEWVQQWEVVDYPIGIQVQKIKEARAAAYREEADPLFFKWQAGEGSKEEWEASRAAIRARYPYPEGEA